MTRIFALFALITALGLPSAGQAQWSDEFIEPESSPERFGAQIGVGLYRPTGDEAVEERFDEVFGDDRGPVLQLELDVFAYRIPYVGLIGGGFGFSWISFTADACVDQNCTTRSDEETSLTLFPLSFLAVLRVDVLAEHFDIPLVVTGKIGIDTTVYNASTGETTNTRNASVGLRWGLQFALQLDFIKPRAAKILDEDWGINHTHLFFELYGSGANSKLAVGTSLAWTAGLSLTF